MFAPSASFENDVPPEEFATRHKGSDNSRNGRGKPGRKSFGGEAAPDLTPEQFRKLMDEGRVSVDGRGRVRASSDTREHNEGMSLRKRRAWYGVG